MKNGAAKSAATISRNATTSLLLRWRPPALPPFRLWAPAGATLCSMSGPPPEQAGRPHQQHDRHDDEDHRVGGLGEEHLGQAFNDPEAEAGDDRAHDRAHAAD